MCPCLSYTCFFFWKKAKILHTAIISLRDARYLNSFLHTFMQSEYRVRQLILAASMYFWSVSLVYQLFGQFLIFLVDQKKIWLTKKNFGIAKKILVYQKEIWSTEKKIWSTKKIFSIPKKNLVYQKKIWSTKKMWNWPDNWYTKETDQKYMDVASEEIFFRKLVDEWRFTKCAKIVLLKSIFDVTNQQIFLFFFI